MIGTVAMLAAAALAPGVCPHLLPSNPELASRPAVARPVSVQDLVRLRDVGPFGAGLGNESFLAASPDGRHVAFQIRQADPNTNTYCTGLVMLDLDSHRARLVDQGGSLIRLSYTHNGLRRFPTGVPQVLRPSWSPDGRWLVVLKRYGNVTQAWRVRADGAATEQLTHEVQDVTAAAWSADGRRVIFRTDRAVPKADRAIEAEALRGWHYDARFLPMSTTRPFAAIEDQQVLALDLVSRSTVPATPSDRRKLAADGDLSEREASFSGGRHVVVTEEASKPGTYQSPRVIRWHSDTMDKVCRVAACANAQAFWIERGVTSLLLLARSGWGQGDMTFYRWSIASGRMTTLSTTSDLLLGCQALGLRMLCARESSAQPRRLVLLDPTTGQSSDLYNLNPEYDELSSGAVERLRLKSDKRTQTFADVMLPPDFVTGRRYPMVIVQYESRGFLRGGTGDEYPIPALAAAGMIVLSFQRTIDVASSAFPPPRNDDEFNRLDFADWADRRNVHAALMDGVEQMIARGVVDERRIGITGLSDGVGTAAFALLNSGRFSVAALSGCCEEPVGDMVLQGPSFTRMMLAAGYPGYSEPDPAFWASYSVAQNAARLAVPLLLQVADRELLFSLPTVAALRENNVPVDLYVYPDEFHVKWQPAHRAAVLERTLRWFEFWFGLPPLASQVPTPVDEVNRWRAFRMVRQGRLVSADAQR